MFMNPVKIIEDEMFCYFSEILINLEIEELVDENTFLLCQYRLSRDLELDDIYNFKGKDYGQ